MNKHSTNALTYGRGYVFSIQYHIVFCTKYRKPVLIDNVALECETMIQQIAKNYNFTITAMEVMPDHVHMLVDCKPQFFIPDMIKIVKGNTARWMFLKHKELKKQLCGGHLWNPSYCVTTVSERTNEIVSEYINSQKIKEQ